MDALIGAAPDAPWRRLHPLSPVVNLLPQLGAELARLWPLLLVWLVGGTVRSDPSSGASVLVILLGISTLRSWLAWWTLRYRVRGGALELSSGVLSRQLRTLTPQRVQNVEVTQSALHRLFGLAELHVETASDAGAEGALSALTLADATALAAWLSSGRRAAEGPTRPVATTTAGDLLVYAATSPRIGLAAATIATLYEALQSADPERAMRLSLRAGGAGLAAAVALALAGGWIFGFVGAALRHGGFRLEDRGGTLVATEGLLGRRRVELPVGRVQRVIVSMPALRRWLGYATIHVETAVARRGEAGTQRASCTVPLAALGEVDALTGRLLPGAAPIDGPYAPAAPAARRRAVVRGAVTGVTLGAAWAAIGGPLPWLALPLATLGATSLAWLDVRSQGWCVTDAHVLVRRGWLSQQAAALDRHRIQAVSLAQGPIARRLGLARVRVAVAGAGVDLPLLAHDDALRVLSRLVTARPPPGDAP